MSTDTAEGYRLSPQQRHVWKLAGRENADPYVARCTLELRGPLDADALRRALDACVERHEILRTVIRSTPSGEPVQMAGASRAGLQTPAGAGDEDAIDGEAWPGRSPRFDLANGPVLHAALTGRGDRHELTLTLPAYCADHVTLDNLAVRLCDAYDAAGGGRTLPADPAPYRLITDWEYDLLRQDEARVGSAFWRRRIAEAPKAPRLAFERSAPAGPFQPKRVSAALNPSTCERLESMAQGGAQPAAAVVATCWRQLLARLTGQADLLLGVAFDGRGDADLRAALGPLARVLPIAVRIDPSRTLEDVFRAMADAWADAAAWQECFVWSDMPSDDPNGAEPFLPYVFEAVAPAPPIPPVRGLEVSIVRRYACADRFRLRLVLDGAQLAVDYDESRFGVEHVRFLLASVASLVDRAAADPHLAYETLLATDAEERRRALASSGPRRTWDDVRPVHEWFRARAGETPDRIAVVAGETHLSYAALEARANRLARFLRERGAGSGEVVAIALPRSPELVVAIVATLKAGAAFVAVDASLPDRASAILREVAPAVVLVGGPAPDSIAAATDRPVVDLTAESAAVAGQPAVDPAVAVHPEALAYVISTSGSTGVPKGVAIPHGALVNHMHWMLEAFPLDERDVVAQRTPVVFDAAVWELFAPLLSGARLALPSEQATFDGSRLAGELAAHEVSVLQVVPTLLRPLLDAPLAGMRKSLRLLFCGGEPLPGDLHDRCARVLGTAPINLYGPAEACIDTCCWQSDTAAATTIAPIGRPISNVSLYVVDDRGAICPPLVPGELYIGGAAVGRGYVGRPGMTAAAFLPDPWDAEPGARLYRTGDRGWADADGTIHFLGRDDDQVKVRGVRAELEEIRAALARHPMVRDCVVLAQDPRGAGAELVAYVEPTQPCGREVEDEWRAYLRGALPDVMVPAAIRVLDRLPRSPSGKIDRRALALLAENRPVLPRTPTEERLAAVWAEVLGTPIPGVDANFFSLGGHSLLLTQVLARLRSTFEIDLPLRALFDAPTVGRLAEVIDRARRENAAPAAEPV